MTSLYDAIFVGIKRLLEVHAILAKFQTGEKRNEIFVVIFNGELIFAF